VQGFPSRAFPKQRLAPLKRQRKNHTGVLASDSSHEYTVDRRSISCVEVEYALLSLAFPKDNSRRAIAIIIKNIVIP